jgi:hypothetical protein
MAVYKTSFKQNAWSESDICNLRCVDIETKVAYKRVTSGRCAKPGPDPAPGFFMRRADQVVQRTGDTASQTPSLNRHPAHLKIQPRVDPRLVGDSPDREASRAAILRGSLANARSRLRMTARGTLANFVTQ